MATTPSVARRAQPTTLIALPKWTRGRRRVVDKAREAWDQPRHEGTFHRRPPAVTEISAREPRSESAHKRTLPKCSWAPTRPLNRTFVLSTCCHHEFPNCEPLAQHATAGRARNAPALGIRKSSDTNIATEPSPPGTTRGGYSSFPPVKNTYTAVHVLRHPGIRGNRFVRSCHHEIYQA